MELFDLLSKNQAIPPFLSKRGLFVVDDSIGISLLTATAYKKEKQKYLLVASNLFKAQQIYQMISSLLGEEHVFLFPCDELLRAEALAQSKELIANRLFVLSKIIFNEADIIITNLAGATKFLPSPNLFKERIIRFKKGQTYSFDKLKRILISNGYARVNKIDQSLEFAVRGDIVDVYSVNNDYPVRIEFYGDEVESIRFFDIASQTSISEVDEVTILPASEIILSDEEQKKLSDKIYDVLEKDQNILEYGTFEKLRNNVEEDVTKLLEGNSDPKLYKYFSLISENHFTLFDFCKDFTHIFVNKEQILSSNSLMLDESFEYLEELRNEGKIISHLQMYKDIRRVCEISSKSSIVTESFLSFGNEFEFIVKNVPYRANKASDAINIICNYLNDGYKVVICVESKNQINFLQENLASNGEKYRMIKDLSIPDDHCVGISTYKLANGFILEKEKLVFLSPFELFNEKVHSSRYDGRFKEATILKSFEELNPGDYVVHEYQGIGQFLGLETIEVEGSLQDYLKIAYSGSETLYVPLTQFQLVRKYLGREGASPRLSHLHSKDWENTKKKIKERVNELAERLMKLYTERNKAKGFAFPPDDEFQEEFEKSFEYDLTSDQRKALQEIKLDMEKETPMDRLLCGDVGFGKTEVAFEAAFKAINAGKQVAILCPTTLLARQHYELALKRFSPFDIKIAVFSRLIPESTQNKYIKELAEGKIHLAIGTHRLLSKDISFKDLGLLIVDEEQRFGVEQKEKIKELKTNIDILTLTATPIPRTLQISLLGVRSLSKINTAPNERNAIQTYVAPFKIEVAKELIERELGRNGQVFYLHNDIGSLYQCAARLQRLIPNANIGVAHGKMHRDEIEDVMIKFYQGEIQVLVCTSIIENGIDVPNANMIIVEDSDHYGLAQLYQIKGRVGRSNRIAYAYLFYNGNKILTENATKRLKAIQEFTELGSGYRIAQRDLMIRGAGDILGAEQAGFIDSIGLDMYIKLLNETIKEKTEGFKPEEVVPNPSLSIEAYIPSSFANDSDKIELYQEIITAPDEEVLSSIKIRIRDIFGTLPNEVEMLFKKRRIDLLVKSAKIEKLHESEKNVELWLGKEFVHIRGIGNILFEALIPYLQNIKISYANNIFKILLFKKSTWFTDLECILEALSIIIKRHITKEIE